ncbi:MAG TPA: M20/M25/M40 family metallo-hydrolase [Chryseolinea sp.]|nr:M20/M25/M40 family metallo-hydrolase [Chryseolinea sp.]
MKRLITIAFLLSSVILRSQPAVIKQYVGNEKNRHRWLKEYTDFLSIPNVYGDSLNIVKNASFIHDWLKRNGVKSQLLYSGKPRSAPFVYGEVIKPGATTTLAFYAHYDGQPVNPKQWAEGLQPFTPVLMSDRLDKGGKIIPFPSDKDAINSQWRLYGRGSADDKAGVFAIITAYEAIVASALKPNVNIKFFFEGEEEAGSVYLDEIFKRNKELLKADLWIICDGPRHISGKKQVLFGVRGDVNLDLTLYGAKRPLHSGNYGNWAPNPAMRLAQLLATMKDKNGNVLVEGFYDDVIPLSETEKQALKKIPDVEEALKQDLALSKPDGEGKSFMELLNLPTLNINGIQSGNIGSMAANVIPTEATAVIDLRLVLGNDVERQIDKVKRHIEKEGYYVIDHTPSDEERMKYPLLAKVVKRGSGYNAQRTPMDLPLAQKVVKAVGETVGGDVITVPSLGGSLPLYLFEKYLGSKPITVPIVNYDNNQHAENENVILQYLWDGVETMSVIMLMK